MSLGPPDLLAEALSWMGRHRGEAPALYLPPGRPGSGALEPASYGVVSYAELDAEAQLLGRGLLALGLEPGERVAVLVRPGRDLFALSFGLLGVGLVPVLVDPGMGLKALGACLNEARPAGFVGIAEAQFGRRLFGWAKATLRVSVTVGRRWGWGGLTLEDVRVQGRTRTQDAARPAPGDVAAILFTSGSTGLPKGAVYTHANFAAQVSMLRDAFGIRPGEIDLPTFPLFALFDPALGMTTVLPRMDFTRPAKVRPEEVVEPIVRFGVTSMFGSPALLDRVGRVEAPRGTRLPSLKRVLSAGAPVRPPILERFASLLGPEARIHTPYGATEALPVAVIDHRTLLEETRARSESGAGVCVGRPVEGVRVELIRIEDGPLPRWSDTLRVPEGAIGEIVVGSGSVTGSYLHREEATRLAKILDGDQVLHRMGDVGWRDTEGRLWFCGRKSHRVRTAQGDLFTDPVEGVFDAHPAVFRSALVGVRGEGPFEEPVLCVEREPGQGGSDAALLEELRALASQHPHTRTLQRMLVHRGPFPVDVRHNAKIFREALRTWAEGRLR